MNPSLSVVVPLHNVQSTLAGTVEELLEIVPELTPLFEVLLVDDASTDATRDAAHELSLGYPQVQVVAQPRRLGPQDSLRGALRFTQSEFVLGCNDRPEFDLHDLRKLWDRKQSGGAVWGRCPTPAALGSIPQPPVGPTSSSEVSLPDLLLVPRRLLAAWQSPNVRQDVLAHLHERGYDVQGMALRRRSFGGSVLRRPSFAPRPAAQPVGSVVRTPARSAVDRVAPPLSRPNPLHSKIRAAGRGQ